MIYYNQDKERENKVLTVKQNDALLYRRRE